jgi:hypothetical protein
VQRVCQGTCIALHLAHEKDVRPRLAACSVAWNTETLELESADGRTQVVDILWRDALEAVQQHFLTTRYDMGELQFEPRIADRLADQVFDDYCNSFLYYLECSYLPEGQYPLLYELSSDASSIAPTQTASSASQGPQRSGAGRCAATTCASSSTPAPYATPGWRS